MDTIGHTVLKKTIVQKQRQRSERRAITLSISVHRWFEFSDRLLFYCLLSSVLRYINTSLTCKQDLDPRKLITFNYELTSCLWAIFYQWLWPKIKRLAVKRFIRSQNRHRRWLWYWCFWMGCCFTCFFFFLMLCLGKWVVCFGLLLTIGGKV